MANEIQLKLDAVTALTISLASLTTGSAQQSTLVANSNQRPGAIVFVQIKSGGTGPTAGAVYEIYLIRGDDPSSSSYRSDAAGATDAAITIENAALLGTIRVTNTANKKFYAEFDTARLGPLGAEWGIAVKNVSGQTLNATGSDHFVKYRYYVPEVQ